ncbi:MAG: polysaccharide pyruvyl transferase family protein [Clostridia bacterium]|nr:polysaccharide pyruvyl transferase family protein [Clostridia bacterium]
MKNIVLLGIQGTSNLGDRLVCECTRLIIERLLLKHGISDVEIVSYDMLGKKYYSYLAEKKKRDAEVKIRFRLEAEQELKRARTRVAFGTGTDALLSVNAASDCSAQSDDELIEKEFRRRFDEYNEKEKKDKPIQLEASSADGAKIINADTAAVIFFGGGIIKHSHPLRLGYCMAPYIRRADKLGIPVMISAAGVDGFDPENDECRLFAEILNLPCVKTITVRDDLELLRTAFVSSGEIRTVKVACPTFLCRELFPMGTIREPKTIGLGVIKPDKMMEIHPDFTEEKQISLWKEITEQIEKRGFKWTFFANGMPADHNFAKRILKAMKLPASEENLLPNPQSLHQLLDSYNLFEGIIASRFHVAVPCYSYGIPFTELVWNIKQLHFARDTSLEDSFFDPEKASTEQIVDRLFLNMKRSLPESSLDPQSVVDELERFLLTYLSPSAQPQLPDA